VSDRNPTAESGSTPARLPPGRAAVADRLAAYDSLLEVGVGRRPGVAAALADRGCDVTATDIRERAGPEAIRFVRDDVVATAEGVRTGGGDPPAPYRVEAVYALNCPPELHRPARDVARAAGADFAFTTLGGDPPAVPVRRETVGPETLFVAADRR
jgi:uncharacterized UPF0146 family protein